MGCGSVVSTENWGTHVSLFWNRELISITFSLYLGVWTLAVTPHKASLHKITLQPGLRVGGPLGLFDTGQNFWVGNNGLNNGLVLLTATDCQKVARATASTLWPLRSEFHLLLVICLWKDLPSSYKIMDIFPVFVKIDIKTLMLVLVSGELSISQSSCVLNPLSPVYEWTTSR